MARWFSLLSAYHHISPLFRPLMPLLVQARLRQGKEEASRTHERYGVASHARPHGTVVWVHGASVGESLSVLPLLTALLQRMPHLSIVMTTVTVSAAQLLRERLPAAAIHQYSCFDVPCYAERFLVHWRPQMVLWLESELWLNQLTAIHRRHIPLFLLGGRLSKRSFRRWQRAPSIIKKVLSYFDVIFAQSCVEADRFSQLSGRHRITVANLKMIPPSVSVDAHKRRWLQHQLQGRHCWLAASTHDGEEAMMVACHRYLCEHFSDLVTIIAPRHARRGDAIAAAITAANIPLARRSRDDSLPPHQGIYLADTMGEMPLLYESVPVSVIGGSLVNHGGHNPLEAARAKTAVLFGQYMDNFQPLAQELIDHKGAHMVTNERQLSQQLHTLLANEDECRKMSSAAAAFAHETGRHVLDDYLERILPWLSSP